MTLLELVVALSILALLGLIVAQAFRLAGGAWDKGERRAESEQRIRVLSDLLGQRLASVHPAVVKVDGRPLTAFQGSADRVLFYTAPDGQGPMPRAAMVRGQALFVESGKGLVAQESYPLEEGEVSLEPRGTVSVLDPTVTRVAFRYLVPPAAGETEPSWADAWDPTRAADELGSTAGRPVAGAGQPPAEIRVPLAVAMTLVSQGEKGEREVELLFPIYAGRQL